jgi:hypothetical protein
MLPIYEAAWEMHLFLSRKKIPYVVIGGLAVQKWGQPRLTRDLDLTISVPIEKTEQFIETITQHFKARVSDLREFARQTRVLPIYASNGRNMDVSLALPGYEDLLMQRAQPFKLAPRRIIRVCSAEDLIIHKAVAGRPQDLADLQSVIYRNAGKLDLAYIRSWLKEFSLLLESDEILLRFENAWKKWRAASSR